MHALILDGHAAEIIDSIHGAGTSLNILRHAFRLSNQAFFADKPSEGVATIFLPKEDMVRLGGALFSKKAETLLGIHLSLISREKLAGVTRGYLLDHLREESLLPAARQEHDLTDSTVISI